MKESFKINKNKQKQYDYQKWIRSSGMKKHTGITAIIHENENVLYLQKECNFIGVRKVRKKR